MSVLIADWSAFAKQQQVPRMCRTLELGEMCIEATVNVSAIARGAGTVVMPGAAAAVQGAADMGDQAWCGMTALDWLRDRVYFSCPCSWSSSHSNSNNIGQRHHSTAEAAVDDTVYYHETKRHSFVHRR